MNINLLIQSRDIEWKSFNITISTSETFDDIRKKILKSLFQISKNTIILFFDKKKIINYSTTIEEKNLLNNDKRISYTLNKNYYSVNIILNGKTVSHTKILTYNNDNIKELKERVIQKLKLDWKVENIVILIGKYELIDKELLSEYKILESNYFFFFINKKYRFKSHF